MPFLRAALLKKNNIELVPEPAVIEKAPEKSVEILEPEEFTDFATLHKVIDEKIEPEPEEVINAPDVLIEEIIIEEAEPEVQENFFIEEFSQPELPLEEEPKIEPELEPIEKVEEAEEPQEISEEIAEIEEGPEVSEITEIEPEPETEQEAEAVETVEQITESEPKEIKPEEPFKLQYDFMSGERYVDKVSTKTEFDKMLDELAAISKDLLSWEVEKFAKKYTGKFPGEGDKSEADAKKYEAFLGGYITNAAMTLYDNGYRDAAIKQLEQAQSILVARKKLEDETQAIRERVEEEDATVDLSDILGMFGDG